VHGVHRHVLANGSASFQSHPNHANTVRPNPADRAIPHTKDLRAETGSFGAFKPNTFTCARFFFLSRARECVWKGISHSRLMASTRMIGREGLSRFTSWISGFQKRAFALWYSSGVGPARCRCVAHEMLALIPNCGLCVFMCASRQTVPNHVFAADLKRYWCRITFTSLAVQTWPEALSQTAFAEDRARDSKLLLARDGGRGLRCSPAHLRFVNIRGRAAYADQHGMHRAARSSRK